MLLSHKKFPIAAVALLIVIVALVTFLLLDKRTAAPQQYGLFLPTIAERLPNIAAIAVTTAESQLFIERDGAGNWFVASEEYFPADTRLLQKRLLDLTKLEIVEPKTAIPANFPLLQVNEISDVGSKAMQIDLSTAAGSKIASFIIGKQDATFSPTGNAHYFMRHLGETQSWLVSGVVDFPKESSGWLLRELIHIDQERVQDIVLFKQSREKPLVVQRENPYQFDFSLKHEDKAEIDQLVVNALGAVLSRVRLQEIAPKEEIIAAATLTDRGRLITFDGLLVQWQLYQASDSEETYIVLQAQQQEAQPLEHWEQYRPDDFPRALPLQEAEAVQQEVEVINSLAQNWAFKLEDFKVRRLRTQQEDIVQ